MTAKIITFEGPDRHGKSTQARLLFEAYQAAGKRVAFVKLPTTYSPRTHRLIYAMLADGRAKRWPTLFQLVQLINRLLFQCRYMKQLLCDNDIVIFDRWTLSAVVYGSLDGAHRFICEPQFLLFRKPDVTLVFHGGAFPRADAPDDSYERDLSLQLRVEAAYTKWATEHPNDHMLVNNKTKGSAKATHEDIVRRLPFYGVV